MPKRPLELDPDGDDDRLGEDESEDEFDDEYDAWFEENEDD